MEKILLIATLFLVSVSVYSQEFTFRVTRFCIANQEIDGSYPFNECIETDFITKFKKDEFFHGNLAKYKIKKRHWVEKSDERTEVIYTGIDNLGRKVKIKMLMRLEEEIVEMYVYYEKTAYCYIVTGVY
jgi:hypothetical protein